MFRHPKTVMINYKNTDRNRRNRTVSPDERTLSILKEAYLFALPIVMMDITRRQMTNKAHNPSAVALNTFKHLSKFPDASYRHAVRANTDAYYSTAWLDLRAEPMVLSVPYTMGRYYMLPMLDAYTNVFASPGKRTTGTNPADFLIAGPQWCGLVPENMKVISAPTNMVWILGRIQVNSKEDGADVVEPIQQRFRLTPLSAWRKPHSPGLPKSDPTVPKGQLREVLKRMSLTNFFNYFNSLVHDNPPNPADQPIIDRLVSIGIRPGNKFHLKQFSTEVQRASRTLPAGIFTEFRNHFNDNTTLVNGWKPTTGKLGSYGTDYWQRAYIAYVGLGATIPADTIYVAASYDSCGVKLHGSSRYVIRFPKGGTPPTHAFWSLTLYDSDGCMVKNSINRYAIGDRSHLNRNRDGSIDIYIQFDAPGREKQTNWLPAPTDEFNLLLRIYWPREELLEGEWRLPSITRVSV
jgi:hypothetical protein